MTTTKVDRIVKHLKSKKGKQRNDMQAWKKLKELSPETEKWLMADIFFKYEVT